MSYNTQNPTTTTSNWPTNQGYQNQTSTPYTYQPNPVTPNGARKINPAPPAVQREQAKIQNQSKSVLPAAPPIPPAQVLPKLVENTRKQSVPTPLPVITHNNRSEETHPAPSGSPIVIAGQDQYGNPIITNRPGVVPNTTSNRVVPAPSRSSRSSSQSYSETIRGRISSASPDRAGRLHQMLAFSYKQSGQVDQAKTEFQKAIQAYQQQINSGVRRSEAEQGMDTCRRALETLD
jgi:hypothetical protein